MGLKFRLSPFYPLQKVFLLGFKYFSWNQSADQGPSMKIYNETESYNAFLTVFTSRACSPLLFWVERVTIGSICYNVECSYLKAFIWFFGKHS